MWSFLYDLQISFFTLFEWFMYGMFIYAVVILIIIVILDRNK